MLLKRILAGILCAVIMAGCVFYGVTFRFFDRPLSAQAQAEFQSSIALPDNFTLAASVDCAESAKNSLQAVRENIKTGAYALELNVAFNSKNEPYLADGPEYITEKSVTLEKVLLDNDTHDYIRYLLNLRNIVPLQKLKALLKKYDLLNRVILCGVTPDVAKENSTDFAGFNLCTEIDASSINLKNAQSCRTLIYRCVNVGAAYVRCSADSVTPELNSVLKSGKVKLIIDHVHTDYEMYYALSLNPRVIITDRPAELYTLLYANDYLHAEIKNSF